MLSLPRILIDGTILSLVMSAIIFASIRYNPRLWLQDYPAEIRAKVPPINAQEKRAQRLMMIPFLLVLIGLPVYSTYLLRLENGGTISFLSAYLNAFFVLNLFNLFDAVVIDLLIGTFIKPRFAVIPGAEGMEYVFRNWGWHLANYLKGIVFCAIFSLPLALVALVI